MASFKRIISAEEKQQFMAEVIRIAVVKSKGTYQPTPVQQYVAALRLKERLAATDRNGGAA